MTGGLLDFFTLEASEYVEQLDGLVSRATSTPPDAADFGRVVRALRGSATMAKVTGVASLATALERFARGVREGSLTWTPATRGVAISTIDDAKILIRAVRAWSPAEDARVAARVAEIDSIAPMRASAAPRSATDYLATTTADAAAALLAYAENPGGADQFAKVMDAVRALRGVAALKDLPPLGEVVDAVDSAAKPIELGHDVATADRRRLFRTAARVLLEGGDAVRLGNSPPTDSPALREFTLASSSLSGNGGDGDDVVPIAQLLAAGNDSVQAAPNPPTTAAHRFRLEVVSQAEHLRRLVHDGRTAADAATRDRVSRELRNAVRGLARAAQSFGALEIANLFLAAERGAATLDPTALDVLDRGAMLLSAQESAPDAMAPQFVTLSEMLTRTLTPLASATPAAARAPVAAPAAAPFASSGAAMGAPSGASLKSLLAQSLSGLAPLNNNTFAAPLVGEEDDVIPVEDLLFRGKDALARALELGDALRQSGVIPDAATLGELYDLLQLAAAE
jgi:hypothetical protein